MCFADHPPPHFHADYGEHRAIIDLRTLAVIGGHLPPRAMGLVVEWASQHEEELWDLWERAVNCQPLYKLPPLT
jgi:hypothetical protein